MFRLTKKILKVLDNSVKIKLIFLTIMMIIGGVMESLSISLVFPLIATIAMDNNWNDPWYAKVLCSFFKIDNSVEYIKTLLILLICIFVIKNVYLMTERYIQYGFVAKNKQKMQENMMKKVMEKPYEFFINLNSGEIVRLISGDSIQVFALLENLLTFYTEGFVCLVLSITLLFMNPLISAFSIVTFLLESFILSKSIRPLMSKYGDEGRIYTTEANKWMLGAISGIKSIKVSNTSEFFTNMYSANTLRVVESERKGSTLNTIPKVFIETFTIVSVFVLMLFMVDLFSLSELIPVFSTFAVAAIRLLPSVSNITYVMNNTKYEEGALDNVIELANNPNKYYYGISRTVNCKNELINFKKEIKAEHITFNYLGSDKKILEDASMTIKIGDSIGIVGTSGAGKTTLVDILLGLLKPVSGKITVDNINIEDDMNGWLKNLAYIPQTIFLIDDTIKANVAFGIETSKVSNEKVWESLKEAQLDEFVKELPDGLNTKVGERGVKLSGGQCQRIGIARALYNNPKVLIFDEATSSLDNKTEKAIMKSINNLKGKKTMIIIAHRLSTIEECDKIYRVKNGKIKLESKRAR